VKLVELYVCKYRESLESDSTYSELKAGKHQVLVHEDSVNFAQKIISIVEEAWISEFGSLSDYPINLLIESNSSFRNGYVAGAFFDPEMSKWKVADKTYQQRYAAFLLHNALLSKEFKDGNTAVYFGSPNTKKKEELRLQAFRMLDMDAPEVGHFYK
jgi:hypothetical protein